MAGHNKWSKIRHRKAVVDKRRSKVWSKIARVITVAARHHGPDPNFNLNLRYALDEARYANMPRDVIERAIKKGTGGDDQDDFESTRYEGFGPGGVAVIVDALTNNRTRTVNDVRDAFAKNEGNLGASGCVSYMFKHLGVIAVDAGKHDDLAMMDLAIDAGASDASPPEEPDDESRRIWTLTTEPTLFEAVRQKLEKAGFKIIDAQLSMVPDDSVAVSGEAATNLIDMIDALEDLDDVQKIWTNAESL